MNDDPDQPWLNAALQPPPKVVQETQQIAQRLNSVGQPFLFNTDLDGVLSSEVLRRHLGRKPIGLCACTGSEKDRLWIEGDKTAIPDEAAYVDMFVVEAGRLVIDQHIVSLDAVHAEILASRPEKINPNLIWTRTAETGRQASGRGYELKYPFGVTHFIIALIESLGKQVVLENREITAAFSAFDLLLRADDAGRTTAYNYRANALCWWSYLVAIGGETTRAIAQYATSQSAAETQLRQDAVEKWLRASRPRVSHLGKDANFASCLRKDNTWKPEVTSLLDIISRAVWGADAGFRPGRLSALTLEGQRAPSYEAEAVRRTLALASLFSYAFTSVNGPVASRGFSYTLRNPSGERNREGDEA